MLLSFNMTKNLEHKVKKINLNYWAINREFSDAVYYLTLNSHLYIVILYELNEKFHIL